MLARAKWEADIEGTVVFEVVEKASTSSSDRYEEIVTKSDGGRVSKGEPSEVVKEPIQGEALK